MESLRIKAFLSHHFSERVKSIVELVEGICRALDITFENVHHASSHVPIEEARSIMKESNILIGLCTRDQKFDKTDTYSFSNAVQQEITMAHELRMPVALFVEKGVEATGFYGHMATYDTIDISEGITAQLVESFVKGIHREKVRSINESELGISQDGTAKFFVERSDMEIELEIVNGVPCWTYVMERKFCFLREFTLPLRFGVWPLYQSDVGDITPEGNAEIIDSNSEFKLTVSPASSGKNSLELIVELSPFPTKGDHITFRETYHSPGLNPIYAHNAPKQCLTFGNRAFHAADGLCLINRVKELLVRLRFPKGYPLAMDEISPVVGTFSTTIDNVVEREIDRIMKTQTFEKRTFNGRTEAVIKVREPLYQHFYGICWNPPEKHSCSL